MRTQSVAKEKPRRIRWGQNDGEPFCPRCGCVAVYTYRSRPIYKCQVCESQFSITTDTQPKTDGTGYSQQQLDSRTWRVQFAGNKNTSRETVEIPPMMITNAPSRLRAVEELQGATPGARVH